MPQLQPQHSQDCQSQFAPRCALLGLWLLLCTGCDFPGRPDPNNRPEPENKVVAFEPLFRRNCAGCHGADGQLGPAPPLNDPIFLAIMPDAELLQVIRSGRPGTPMPAFAHEHGGDLTDAQVTALAEGIKSHWKAAPSTRTDLPEYLLAKSSEGVAAGDRQRGAEIFARTCADCHGVRDESGKLAEGMAGPIDDPSFLALISDQALRRIIITGRPDLGMPNYSESDGRADDFQPLTSADIEDLVALLASWRTRTEVAAKNPASGAVVSATAK